MTDKSIIGAYVKDVKKGIYKNIGVCDITSSYPNQIISVNISPETRVKKPPKELIKLLLSRDMGYFITEYGFKSPKNQAELDYILKTLFWDLDWFEKHITPILKKYQICLTPNLTMYRTKDLGVFPTIVKDAFETRKLWKKTLRWLESEIYNLLKSKKIDKNEARKRILQKAEELSFNQEISNFLKEIEDVDRIEEKIQTIDLIQYALKVEINSFYGAFSNKNFKFFNKDDAQTITAMGQLCIRGVANYIEEKFPEFKNIYTDTDSCFLQFPFGLNEFLEKIPEINEVIDEYFVRLSNALNLHERRIFMEWESFSDYAIFIAKKKYIMRLLWKEGIFFDPSEFKFKVKGFEIVKSSTPDFVKEKLENLLVSVFKYISGEDRSIDWKKTMLNWFNEFKKQPVERIAISRYVNKFGKYRYKWSVRKAIPKGTPIHIKGALVFNELREKLNLPVPPIYEGDKIAYVYVDPRNFKGTNVITFKDRFPKEFYQIFKIDYKTQFEKTMIQPLEHLFSAIGLEDVLIQVKNYDKRLLTLYDFFGGKK